MRWAAVITLSSTAIRGSASSGKISAAMARAMSMSKPSISPVTGLRAPSR